MDADITAAIIEAANIFGIPHKNMAFALSVALRDIARTRSGIAKAIISTLADDFLEAS